MFFAFLLREVFNVLQLVYLSDNMDNPRWKFAASAICD